MTARRLNDVTPEEWNKSCQYWKYPSSIYGHHEVDPIEKKIWESITPMEDPTQDKIVESVVDKYRERSRVGIEKYGTTLERNDLSFDQWLNHISEELMDAVLYIERVREENRKVGE